jgi:2-polyprenyl-3-methyl-5-hydroxy-6-metoxy-1,4-benzoquinol methylase
MTNDLEGLTAETKEIWNQNAGWWDDYVGPEGNDFHRTLVGPTTSRLLGLQPGERVLDIACGNGQFAREMARMGIEVVACDFSEVFIERAKTWTAQAGLSVDYHVLDATDEAQLLALGQNAFDAAVCSMGLMDMTTIDPLFSALNKLLKPGGRFVFSVSHPCFNSTGCRMSVEEEVREGERVTVYSVKVSAYRKLRAERGTGIRGQPTAHYYFDRAITDLLGAGFAAGFVVDGFEEPVFEPSSTHDGGRPFSWSHYDDIPPLLVVRMRLPG